MSESQPVAVTGPDQRPDPHPFYGDSYERGLDPWHADAFKGIPAVEKAIEEGRVVELGKSGGVITSGERRAGWFLIDGAGNAIGWVPDGTPVNRLPEQKVLIVSESNEERIADLDSKAADDKAFEQAVAQPHQPPATPLHFAEPGAALQQEHILQFFDNAQYADRLDTFAHRLRELAHRVVRELPRNPERTVALRALLDAGAAIERCARAQ